MHIIPENVFYIHFLPRMHAWITHKKLYFYWLHIIERLLWICCLCMQCPMSNDESLKKGSKQKNLYLKLVTMHSNVPSLTIGQGLPHFLINLIYDFKLIFNSILIESKESLIYFICLSLYSWYLSYSYDGKSFKIYTLWNACVNENFLSVLILKELMFAYLSVIIS